MPSAIVEKIEIDKWAVLREAAKRAGQGGVAGAASIAINICTMMWMRTIVYYQYRYGTTTTVAMKTLYADGGIPRFYRGLLPALIQGPLARFGDIAANTGTLAGFNAFESTAGLPLALKTGAASIAAGLFRIVLMPIDTLKISMQVGGKNGLPILLAKFRTNGISVFFQGSIAAAAATIVGHYPWFFVFNYLTDTLPKSHDFTSKVCRSAVIGFCSSAVSDTCSNSIRVVKVYKQSSTDAISYPKALKRILKEDGIIGVFGRGLKTKIIANGMQGIMFSVLYKLIDERLFPREETDKEV